MSDPYERRFVNAFAAALQMLEQYKDAISHYTTASIMDLSDPAPTFHIAECLIPLGMVTEARRALGFVLAQCTRPNHAALKERARALLELLDPGIK